MKNQLLNFRGAATALLILLGATSCKKNANTDAKSALEMSTAPRAATTYQLLWSDDFDKGLDSTKWSVVTGNENVNHELQAYVPSGVLVANGFLQFTASKQNSAGQSYTSGKITTAGKFSIKNGRIEARLKMPLLAGLAPAFTMQGVKSPAIKLPGEIDIMQHADINNNIIGGIRWDNGGAANFSNSFASNTSSPGGFRVYAVEWDDQEIRWFVDGIQYGTANIANNINSTEEFHVPFFINLNLAVGGDLTRQPVLNGGLPTSMVVDYVKVYQQTGTAGTIGTVIKQ